MSNILDPDRDSSDDVTSDVASDISRHLIELASDDCIPMNIKRVYGFSDALDLIDVSNHIDYCLLFMDFKRGLKVSL